MVNLYRTDGIVLHPPLGGGHLTLLTRDRGKIEVWPQRPAHAAWLPPPALLLFEGLDFAGKGLDQLSRADQGWPSGRPGENGYASFWAEFWISFSRWKRIPGFSSLPWPA